MNYDEAKKLAAEWTHGQDVSLDGWRSVIALLLARVEFLENHLKHLNDHVGRLLTENEALSLDLGLKKGPQTIKDIIRETQERGTW